MVIKRKLPSKTGNISNKEVMGSGNKPATPSTDAPKTPVTDAVAPPVEQKVEKPKSSFDDAPKTDAFAPPTEKTAVKEENAPKLPPKAKRGELQVDDLPKTEAPRKKEPVAEPPKPAPDEFDLSDELPSPSPANFSSLDPAAPAGSPAAAQQGFGENDWVDLDDITPPKPVTPAVAATPEAMDDIKPEAPKPWESTATQGGDAEDAWELGDLVPMPEETVAAPAPTVSPIPDMPRKSADAAPVAPPPPSRGASPFDAVKPVDSPKLPPWKRGAEEKKTSNAGSPGSGGPRNTPPILPTQGKNGNMVGTIISLAVVGLVVLLGIMFFQNRDKAIEMMARWTGTLNKVSQEMPDGRSQRPTILEAEAEVPHQVLEGGGVELKVDGKASSTVKVDIVEDDSGAAQVRVEQVPVPEASEDEQLSDFERLQKALERQRAKHRQDTGAKLKTETETFDPNTLSTVERTQRNLELIGSVNEDLSAYRKALSGTENPALKPKPGDFFRERQRSGDETTPGAVSPLVGEGGRGVVGAAPQAPEEIPEELDDGIRKLMDFVDALPQGDVSRVRVPKGLTPRISGSDFPPLELLSLIPNYGIVGMVRGREGVLMLGETLENWELVAVYDGYAEFRLGSRNKIVTINDANR